MDQIIPIDSPRPNVARVASREVLGEPEAEEIYAPIEDGPEPLRFPGEDGGQALAEMAKRDLEATLQLLAERALHVTGASGALIALRQEEGVVCRASAGVAPKVDALIDTESGLCGESMRTRRIARCPDTANDPRVDGKNCQEQGIASAVVMPLLRDGEIIGVFELVSAVANAFEERDIVVLERLGEMIGTAADLAEAAGRAQKGILPEASAALRITPGTSPEAVEAAAQAGLPSALDCAPGASTAGTKTAAILPEAESLPELTPDTPLERRKIGRCSSCGFPVSEGRTLCLDCDASHYNDMKPVAADESGIDALRSGEEPRPGWLRSNIYVIGTVLVTAATVALALWLRR